MRDIWAFLMQTLTVSGAAVVVLIVKAIFKDKLSPRWQFAVWSVLGLVLLIPAGRGGQYVLFDWPVLVETVKSLCTGRHDLTAVTAPIPLLPKSTPSTLFDWLFLVYLLGVLLLMCRYLISYLRLRRLLARSAPVSGDMMEKIEQAEKVYSLKACRTVMVPGLDSAFVCGLIRPVLALPADRDTDEKVLLHELLHLKHRDVLWGTIIGFFRCIHWCNPLLWYCADRAGNDLESLCDQRVLERLEGEARRDYGRILLDMTNEKYARAPGTSSAANGGKNIRQRIEAITRFKRYPQGMGLVSICVVLILAFPLAMGTTVRAVQAPYVYSGRQGGEMESALSAARVNRCTTLAGALDTYAKAVLNRSVTYRVMCAPMEEQEGLARLAGRTHYWECGYPGIPQIENGYHIFGMEQVGEDTFETTLVLEHTWVDEESHRKVRPVVQVVRAEKEEGRWVVLPVSEFKEIDSSSDNLSWNCWELGAPSVVRYGGEAENFRIEILYQNVYTVDNKILEDGGLFGILNSSQFDSRPKPQAQFESVSRSCQGTVTHLGTAEERASITMLGVSYDSIYGNEEPQLPEQIPSRTGIHEDYSNLVQEGQIDMGSSSSGGCGWSISSMEPGWGPEADFFGGGGSAPYDEKDPEIRPDHYAAALYINSEDKTTELVLEREEMEK